MDDNIDQYLAEVRARQANWIRQAQRDAQAIQAKKAHTTAAWRFYVGVKLIRLGERLARNQGGPAISKLN